MSTAPTSRAERRRQTEARILAAARALFAERGYERTTIRAVAAAAGVDPALVMQYFGAKQELFSRAAQGADDRPLPASPEQLTELMLATLGMKISGLPETSLAMLRSMLTHPEANESVRAALDRQVERTSEAIGGPDARLRAALVVTSMVGLTIGHQLLQLDALREATTEQITEALRPAFQALLAGPAGAEDPPGAPAQPAAGDD
ncbi:TetR family transcriptional regulator [Micromonospora sp. NPDC049559]|uniref:TetR/AcrR family transcriptional regulator n=1 Tax=Micromonospora sp. NPDC049559 TaxID=3155923 RepID=UPI0034492FF2